MESQTIETELVSPEPVQMSLAETVALVGRYMREIRDSQGDPQLWAIAERLGWSEEKLKEFRDDHEGLLTLDANIAMAAPPEPVIPPTDGELLARQAAEIPSAHPTDEQVAMAVAAADQKFARGLRNIGLKPREVEAAEALQQLNQEHFKESMDVVSATVLRTDLKCVLQQDEITKRLEFVRAQIESYGEFASDDRDKWVREERLLMQQFLELGQLTVNIQETWYKGAAHLALIRMRYGKGGGGGPMTQRSNKPKFSPNNAR